MSTHNYILGISAFFHDSAAALLKDGEIIAAASEERFTRRKADWRHPFSAIEYCLSHIEEGQALNDVAYYENPRLKMDRIFKNALDVMPQGARLWPQTVSTLDQLNHVIPNHLRRLVGEDNSRVHFTTHHRAHAASAFYPSPFDEAAILVVDGVGEWTTTSIWHGKGNEVTALKELRFPHSLGLFYSAFTQYCGFKVNSGEYKLMGLAPFGEPIYKDIICNNLIDINLDGSFALNLKYFSFHHDLSTINPRFVELFGQKPKRPEEPFSQFHMNVAASCQAVTMMIMERLARSALTLTGSSKLCLAGGVALNCVSNGEIARNIKTLKHIWVQPAAGDAGGALGAALQLAATKDMLPKKSGKSDLMHNAYLGPEYSQDEMVEALDKEGLKYTRFETETDGFYDEVISALEEGQIIGHFNGRMEYGPRALGNRSILADVRPEDMLQRVNRKIKFREGWRPFAPMILAEEAKNYFTKPTDSPYMLMVSKLKTKFRKGPTLAEIRAKGITDIHAFRQSAPSDYPAITHYDYSARVQTVTRQSNPRIHNLMTRFKKNTGSPMLLNTSFNVRGEPIVCTPQDAVTCFLNTHLDMLVLGNIIVKKSEQGADIADKIGKVTFDAD